MTSTDTFVRSAQERLSQCREGETKAFTCFCKDYRANEKTRSQNRKRYGLLKNLWSLEDATNLRVRIIGENGIGDEILTASCLRDFIRRGAPSQVTWRGDVKLEKLLTRSFPEIYFETATQAEKHAIDASVYAWELIGRTRTTLEDFAWTRPDAFYEPYLKHSPSLAANLRERYSDGQRPIVGLAWRSERYGQVQNDKTCDLRDAAYWTTFFGTLKNSVSFISLQYGDTQDDIAFARWRYGAEIYHDARVNIFDDVDAAAAQIAAMDYVVTISTTTAHLAGALGIPSWAILTKRPFAHWRAGNRICPFYPTLRPVRQQRVGDWKHVLEIVAEELFHEVSRSQGDTGSPEGR